MNSNELIALLSSLPPEEREKPIMLETEHDIYFNLRLVKYRTGKFVLLSMYPDPFEEALKRAGVE